jgi:hypothetical protein
MEARLEQAQDHAQDHAAAPAEAASPVPASDSADASHAPQDNTHP